MPTAPTVDTKKAKKYNAFTQQRLKTWQPILTPKFVIPTFFVIGSIMFPLGLGLFIVSLNVNELIFDYSGCINAPVNFTSNNVGDGIERWKFDPVEKVCTVQFRAEQDFISPVFMYYRLTNYFQNHRQLLKSFDAAQLGGAIIETGDQLSDRCGRFKKPNPDFEFPDGTKPDPDAQYYPCGQLASSMFSDRISNLTNIETRAVFEFSQDNIMWPSDNFRQTEWINRPDEIGRKLVPPLNWQQSFEEYKNGYNISNLPNLAQWGRFQNWVRAAGLPNFRKLYARSDNQNLASGTYEVTIKDTFDVKNIGSTKSIVISTISLLGGKNPALGVAYMIVGTLCLVCGALFLFVHMVKPRKVADISYLSWNRRQFSPKVGSPIVLSTRPPQLVLDKKDLVYK